MPLGYDLGVQCPRPSGEAHGHAVAAHALYRAGAKYRVPHVGTNGRDALHIHRRQGARAAGGTGRRPAGSTSGRLRCPGRAANTSSTKAERSATQSNSTSCCRAPGHGDVEQPPVLLVLLGLARGAAGKFRLGRKDAVQHIQQNHPVVFQPLGGVYRG